MSKDSSHNMLTNNKKKKWSTEFVSSLHIKLVKFTTLSVIKFLYLNYLPYYMSYLPLFGKVEKNQTKYFFRNYSRKYDKTHNVT